MAKNSMKSESAECRTPVTLAIKAPESVKRYQCPECGKGFVQRVSLTRHRLLHGENPRPHACPGCDKAFSQYTDLKKHLVLHSDNPKPYLCNFCSNGFAQSAQRDRHQVMSHGLAARPKKQKCEVCGKAFQHVCDLKRHLDTHLEKRVRFPCTVCDKTFAQRGQMTVHVKQKHPEVAPAKKPLELMDANTIKRIMSVHATGKGNPNPTKKPKKKRPVRKPENDDEAMSLIIESVAAEEIPYGTIDIQPIGEPFHIDSEVEQEIVIVMIDETGQYSVSQPDGAPKSNRRIITLQAPDRYVDGAPEHYVEVAVPAPEHYEEATALDEFVEVAATPEPSLSKISKLAGGDIQITMENEPDSTPTLQWNKSLECDQCSARFSHEQSLRKHVEAHGRLHYMHRCEICNVAFTKRESLKRHQVLHSGHPKPFTCPICNKGFSQHGDIKRHMILHSENPKPFKCSQCDQAFTQRWTLKRHEKFHSDGNEGKPHKCTDCPKTFMTRYDLKRHTLVHGTEKPYKCTSCERGFNQPGHLRRHFKLAHIEAAACETHGKGKKGPLKLTRHHVCPHCGRFFHRKQNLLLHITIHQQQEFTGVPVKAESGDAANTEEFVVQNVEEDGVEIEMVPMESVKGGLLQLCEVATTVVD